MTREQAMDSMYKYFKMGYRGVRYGDLRYTTDILEAIRDLYYMEDDAWNDGDFELVDIE